ncbi:hypothetical protein Q1695_003361 [Nippostrongylus brasiliensis]|nr:hypothetical protein Q1695_003361 [Nippostrongylus brasiliensis]
MSILPLPPYAFRQTPPPTLPPSPLAVVLLAHFKAEPVVSQHTQWGRSVGGRLVDDHRRIVVDDVRHRLDHMVMSDAISPPAHLRPMVAVTVAGGVDCAITVMSTSNPDIGEMGRIRSRRFALSI